MEAISMLNANLFAWQDWGDYNEYNTTIPLFDADNRTIDTVPMCLDQLSFCLKDDKQTLMSLYGDYTRSFLASIHLIMAGENLSPVTLNEKWTSSILMMLGFILMAYVFGEVQSYARNYHVISSEVSEPFGRRDGYIHY